MAYESAHYHTLSGRLHAPLLNGDNNDGAKQKDVELQPIATVYGGGGARGATSFFKTCLNGLNALSGVGILSVPYALASGGWLSLIFLFVIALATFYTGLLIKRCMDVKSDIKTYPEIGELAFGSNGKIVVSVFMYVELYLVATGFLILEGDNLNNMFPNVGVEFLGFRIAGQPFFVLVVALIILPTVWLEDLSLLSFVSASGVLASTIIVASVFWCGAFDGIGFQQNGILINWKGIPNSISLFAFCYCAHPVFPTLYTSMKNKRQFSNVLTFCFIICTFGYASMAVMGYAMFGSDIQSQITLNLPTGKLSSLVAIYTTLVNPICKYALMTVPIVSAIKNRFPFINHNSKPLTMLISTSLLVTNVIVALAIPFFGSLMSLVGALLSVTACIILPCVCYLKISGNYKRFGFEMVIISSIILIGVVAGIIGTYVALVEIVGKM